MHWLLILLPIVAAAQPQSELVGRYMLSQELTYNSGKLQPKGSGTNQIDSNFFQHGNNWIRFGKTNIADSNRGPVWRLTEVRQDGPLGATVASTVTMYEGHIRSITQCFEQKSSPGSDAAKFSCVSSSHTVCRQMNNMIYGQKDQNGKEISLKEQNAIKTFILKNRLQLSEGKEPVAETAALASSAKMITAATYSAAEYVQREWESDIAKPDQNAIQEMLLQTGKYSKSSLKLTGGTFRDLSDRRKDLEKLEVRALSRPKEINNTDLISSKADILAAFTQFYQCGRNAGVDRTSRDFFGASPSPGTSSSSKNSATK